MTPPKILYVSNYGTNVVTSLDGVQAAVSVFQAALRTYKVSELAELTEKKRKLLLEEVNRVLTMLDIHDVCVEWREEKKEEHLVDTR